MLSPYRVLDLTDHRGELAAMILGDLGADVIRVEPPGGSEGRLGGPCREEGGEGESLQFLAYNRNKRSVVVDLSQSKARAQFVELLAGADFLFESGPPSALAEQGFDFETLSEINPHIVVTRITPFGSDGPHAWFAATDLTVAALSGSLFVQGNPARAPVRISAPQSWRHAGAWAATAALVAHANLRRSGIAQLVDVSAQGAMTWTLMDQVGASTVGADRVKRQGSLQVSVYGEFLDSVFPCRDGFVHFAPGNSEADGFIAWLVEDGWLDVSYLETKWTVPSDLPREGHTSLAKERLFELIKNLVSRYEREELMSHYIKRGVRTAPLNSARELLRLPHLCERDFWITHELSDGRVANAPGAFAKSSIRAIAPPGQTPRLDQHRVEVADAPKRSVTGPQNPDGRLPFEGLKIADFTWAVAGPMSTKILADHGADVVRVESFSRQDLLRWLGPYKDDVEGLNRSIAWAQWNTSKRSVALNLKSPGGIELARKLIGWADVYVEKFSPGTVDRLGIGYQAVKTINPRIIMASSTMMGQTGSGAKVGGWGSHAASIAGFYELTGWPDLPPDGPYLAYTDVIAPMFTASVLMAAVDHQRRTGEGQYIDLSQLEMALHFLAPELLDYQVNGRTPRRMGNRDLLNAPQGIYPCVGEDRWCAIAVASDAQWGCLRKALGNPDWANEPALHSAKGRRERHDDIDKHLSEWTRKRDWNDIMRQLQKVGVAAGVVQGSDDLHRDPQMRHRGFFAAVHEHAELGMTSYADYPYRISGSATATRFGAPCLGEHSEDVLREILGLDASEIAAAVEAGAVEIPRRKQDGGIEF